MKPMEWDEHKECHDTKNKRIRLVTSEQISRAARLETLRKQMAADNPGERDAEAEHTWRNR